MNPRPNTKDSNYFLVSIQIVPARSEKLLQCELKNEDRSKIYSLLAMVTPVEFFHDSSGLWVAETLVRDKDGICWVLSLRVHIEVIVTCKGSRVRILETNGSEHQKFSVRTKPTENAKKEKKSDSRSTSEMIASTCFYQH